jgi:uncharacterized protein (TIGR02284 family)
MCGARAHARHAWQNVACTLARSGGFDARPSSQGTKLAAARQRERALGRTTNARTRARRALTRRAPMGRMIHDVIHLLNDLIEVDYDAIAAYKAAIARLDDVTDKTALGQMLADHRRHVSELSLVVRNYGGEPSAHGDVKAVLTKGRVVLAQLSGEQAIFDAMNANEEDTNDAYDRAINRQGVPIDVLAILERNLADERRHRAWFVHRINSTKAVEIAKDLAQDVGARR